MSEAEQKAEVPTFILKGGGHPPEDENCCAVEYAHISRGKPKKAEALEDESPIITQALIGFNDSFPNTPEGDIERTKYAGRFVTRLAGSRGSIEIEVKRAWMAADWLVRIYSPICFEQIEQTKKYAPLLRALPTVVDAATLDAALGVHDPAARAALGALTARAAPERSAARDALDALDALANLAAHAALDALTALDALAARAARDALTARTVFTALTARDALDARAALAAKATDQEQYGAAVEAALTYYRGVIPQIRESEVDLFERMFALTEKRAEASGG